MRRSALSFAFAALTLVLSFLPASAGWIEVCNVQTGRCGMQMFVPNDAGPGYQPAPNIVPAEYYRRRYQQQVIVPYPVPGNTTVIVQQPDPTPGIVAGIVSGVIQGIVAGQGQPQPAAPETAPAR